MKRKILSCVLACAMIVTTFVSSVVTISAAGENEAKIGDTEYATLAQAIEKASENDVITVLKDVEIADTVIVNKSVTLTAEDNVTIHRADSFKPALFKVQGATLTLSGNLTLEGHANAYGSLVLCTKGTSSAPSSLVMEKGVTLQNNQHNNALYGGAVSLEGPSSFTMNGGTITNCGVSSSNGTAGGGAVRASANSSGTPTITMNDGTISNCFAYNGGAIYLSNSYGKSVASFTMNDGVISGCFAGRNANTIDGSAGAIFLYNKTNTDAKLTTATINGGEITGCKAYRYGILGMNSGVTKNPYNGGTYYILGGHIYNNSVGYNGETTGAPGQWYGQSVYVQGLSKSGEALLVLGGNAVIEEEIYLSKNAFINVRNDFSGSAPMYIQNDAENQVVLHVVDANGEPATSFTGTISLLNGQFDDDGNYLRDPDGNIVPKYELSFDENGNVVLAPFTCDITYTDGVEDAVIFEDQTYSVAPQTKTPAFEGTPTREGYTFVGWAPAVAETAMNNAVYTAQWKANEYTVTFDVNGGNALENDTMTVSYDSAFGTLPVPTREGYVFLGWYDENDTLVTADSIYKTAANTTLSAKWTNEAVTVTFVADGKVVHTMSVVYGTVLDEKVCPAVPEKEGYTGHWKLPTTPITEDTEIVAEYVTTTPPVDTDDSFSVMLPVIFMMLAVAFGAVWMRRKKSI